MLKVLSVTSECAGLVKTGGLADVAGALPAALAGLPEGERAAMTTFLPGYPAVMARIKARAPRPLYAWPDLMGAEARLLATTLTGQKGAPALLVLDAPALFTREGGPYGDDAGRDWVDNPRRFAAFGRAAADIASGIVPGLAFDVIHGHDWQAGMALAYLRFALPAGGRRVPGIMTIHNMAFQGHYGAEIFPALGLPAEAFALNGVEYHGGVGFLKAGLEAAHRITTVSPSYALEIRDPHFGMGLEGLIRARGSQVRGLLNGIDTAEWNPAADPALAAPFTAARLAARRANKAALEQDFGLTPGDGPLFVVISRLTWQKGMDVLPEVIDRLVGEGGRLAVLGSGDAAIVGAMQAAATRHPGHVGVRVGYDEALSHRMQAGGDAILIPSRFEPCGLTQLYALAYGCVPVVARTGGLNDTVIDANLAALRAGVATGVQFAGVDEAGVGAAITRAIDLYRQPAVWRQLQKNGMKADFSWAKSAAAYADLYREIAHEPA